MRRRFGQEIGYAVKLVEELGDAVVYLLVNFIRDVLDGFEGLAPKSWLREIACWGVVLGVVAFVAWG